MAEDDWNLKGFDAKIRGQEDERQRAARHSWEQRAEYLRANGLPVPPFVPPAASAAASIGMPRPVVPAGRSAQELDEERSRVALASWQKRAEYLRANGLPVPAYQPPSPQRHETPAAEAYYPRPAYEPEYQPSPPGVGAIVLVTLFLGLFGLIPAAMKSSRAEALGYPTTPYWKAFWLTLLLPVVFLLILVLASS